MKVIQVIPNFGIAGAEIMCENLVYSLCKLGIDVVVVSLYSQKSAITDRLESAGVNIRYLDKKSGFDFSMIRKLKRIFKEESPDIVHTHRYAIQYAVPAAVLAGIKGRIHTVHNVAQKELGKIKRTLACFFYRHFHVVPVALSDLVRESVVEEYRLNRDNIPVIFNGIDMSRCAPKEDYTCDGDFKILHIGRFQSQKNHAMLISAFARFHQYYSNSTLQLIGEGEGREDAEHLAIELGVNQAVEFLGVQSNVYNFLHDADVFTLPSLYEGMPITLIEAMGTGLPIVATNVGGIPDMLRNGESAVLIDINEDELVEAFLKMFNSAKLRATLGKNARDESSEFSADVMAVKYLKLYERLI